ncbi:hypothetical protein PTE30175_04506 [Pandoraea terrae]|uniref:Uncharacterized protein n=1 Tax=Pandoraea terrae TaxID=1537710 RepID=A0A5E4YNS0_9BURK|nr:hypothetical protein [Pandoraea terrae]VVE49573.1 hypothetical protein PTE30175_04506 [Pandoraea terrae]
MHYLFERLREPSTWAALSGAALAIGAQPDLIHEIAQAGVALASMIAMALPERADARWHDAAGQP